jgi:hypothetical protein
MPPKTRPITSGMWPKIDSTGTAWLRVTKANASVARLMTRLSGTAAFAGKPITRISTGRRNSPPPSPISLASPPIGTAKANAR